MYNVYIRQLEDYGIKGYSEPLLFLPNGFSKKLSRQRENDIEKKFLGRLVYVPS